MADNKIDQSGLYANFMALDTAKAALSDPSEMSKIGRTAKVASGAIYDLTYKNPIDVVKKNLYYMTLAPGQRTLGEKVAAVGLMALGAYAWVSYSSSLPLLAANTAVAIYNGASPTRAIGSSVLTAAAISTLGLAAAVPIYAANAIAPRDIPSNSFLGKLMKAYHMMAETVGRYTVKMAKLVLMPLWNHVKNQIMEWFKGK